MSKGGPLKTAVRYIAVASGLLLLLLIAIQQDALEKRLIEQTRAISAVGEKADRLQTQLSQIEKNGVATHGAPASAEYVDPQAKILHPEVKNFLESDDFKYPSVAEKGGGTYRRGWPFGDPKTLNWVLNTAAEVQEQVSPYLDSAIAGRNTYTDPDKWHGDLAWRIEVTDDFKEYTIYLRRGVKWHVPSGVDFGNPKYEWLKGDHELTAQDFVFTLDMIINPQVENGSLKNYYQDMESWKAIDDYTLNVRWKKKLYQALEYTIGLAPLPRFLFAYNEDGSRIPKETLGIKFNQHWYNNRGYVGTGPYRMATYEPGVQIALERNEDYYGDKPPIQKIVYPIYTDSNQTVLKLKAGELTADRLLRSQYRTEVLDLKKSSPQQQNANDPFANGKISCNIIDLPGYRYIGWNTARSPFDDIGVRQAMTYALNRAGIIKDVFVNMGSIPVGPWVPGSPGHDPAIQPLPFDLKKAADLLTAAGWIDSNGDGLRDKIVKGQSKTLEFSLLIAAGVPEYVSLATIFKEDLLKIGVKLTVEVSEWSLFLKRLHEKDFDGAFSGWALSWAEDPYQIWHSSQADVPQGSNVTGFRNAEADELMVKLRETFDPEQRTQMLRRIQRLIVDSYNYTFVITERRPFCFHNSLKGLVYSKIRPVEYSGVWWLETK